MGWVLLAGMVVYFILLAIVEVLVRSELNKLGDSWRELGIEAPPPSGIFAFQKKVAWVRAAKHHLPAAAQKDFGKVLFLHRVLVSYTLVFIAACLFSLLKSKS